jgi:CubicO group peptidase (beta-lactamase class C family)
MHPVRNALIAFAAPIAATLAAGQSAAWPLPATTPAEAGFSAERLGRLHATLDRTIDEGKYAGYVLLLARDGKIVDWSAHGWADVATRTPIARDSIVRLCSMTKLITSTAVLMLMEDGRLKLDDPVEKFLPALKDRKVLVGGTADAPELVPAQRPVTIRDLLSHTSGYCYEFLAPGEPLRELYHRAEISKARDFDDYVARVARVPLVAQPGTEFHYSISTDLLGAVVEKASGQPFDEFLQQRIFAPLGLRDTGFWVPDEKLSRVAKVHARDASGKLIIDPGFAQQPANAKPAVPSGGGGLFSTAADYARFAQMLLNGGELDSVRLLGRKTVELMTRNHLSALANPHPFGIGSQGFGLGVRVITDLGQSFVPGSSGSFGWDGAATTTVQIDPKERTVAILLFQHNPMNEDNIFSTFTTGYYSALAD